MRKKHTGLSLFFAFSTLLGLSQAVTLDSVKSSVHPLTFAAVTAAAPQPVQLSALTNMSTPALSAATGGDDYFADICKQGEYHWQADKLPIKVFIGDGTGTPGYRPQFRGMVRDAFNTWENACGDRVSWKEVKSPSNADINVTWTSQVTERANGTEAGETNAYTQLNRNTGRGIIYGARMQLLTQLPERQFSDLEMKKTILHETGHAFGLQGHSTVPTDIMYYAINPQQQAALTDRDVATITHLYTDYSSADDVALKTK